MSSTESNSQGIWANRGRNGVLNTAVRSSAIMTTTGVDLPGKPTHPPVSLFSSRRVQSTAISIATLTPATTPAAAAATMAPAPVGATGEVDPWAQVVDFPDGIASYSLSLVIFVGRYGGMRYPGDKLAPTYVGGHWREALPQTLEIRFSSSAAVGEDHRRC